MLFTASFLAVLLSVSAVDFNFNKAVKNPLMKKEWASMKPAVSRSVTPSDTVKSATSPAFLIATLSTEGSTCGGATRLIVGTGFNTCMVGMDNDGKVVGSQSNMFISEDASTINYVAISYNSTDCTGNSQQAPANIPKKCLDADGSTHVIYSTTADLHPWVKYPTGMVQE